MFTNGFFIVPLVRILCIIFGSWQTLKAVWILKNGGNQREFIVGGVIGIIIFSFPWWGLQPFLSLIPPIISHN